jgi:hypothetical protein
VLLVPAFDCPASECIVSAFVASVGAVDLLLRCGTLFALIESSYEVKLPTRSEPGENEDVPPPLVTLGAGGLWRWPDSGYGLFLPFQCFFALDTVDRCCFLSALGCGEVEVVAEFLRFASRFIHDENGLLLLWRSMYALVSFMISAYLRFGATVQALAAQLHCRQAGGRSLTMWSGGWLSGSHGAQWF